jgi:hypothetical protein
MDGMERITNLVREELQQELEHYPPFNSAHEGLSVICERTDQLRELVRKHEHMRAFLLAKQLAAVAMRFMIDVEHKHLGPWDNLPPCSYRGAA